MPIDRDQTLRTAKGLLREGEFARAIAESRSLTEAAPEDWRAARLLAVFYLRDGQIARALSELRRIADGLSLNSDRARAAAYYRRILRIDPGDEQACVRLLEIGTLPAAEDAPPPRDLDAVFAQFREEAWTRFGLEGANADYDQGVAQYERGELDAAIQSLEAAARAPGLRFEAASALATIHLEQGRTATAIEWLERAAQAPAPTPDAGYWALLRLADALESIGEAGRALAVCLELRSIAGSYDDVDQRVTRLRTQQEQG